MLDELKPFGGYTPPLQNETEILQLSQKVGYNLTTSKIEDEVVKAAKKGEKDVIVKGKAKVCLIPQSLCDKKLLGRFVTNDSFKAVDSENEITVISDLDLAHVQDFDYKAEPFVKEIRVKVVSESNQISQRELKLEIHSFNRLGESVVQELNGKSDDETNEWVFNVNQQISFDKAVYYALLSEISIDIKIVY
jgi:NCAIR mutase (PurE)-related protein